jgi:purine-binding chemotaxis protein CheW
MTGTMSSGGQGKATADCVEVCAVELGGARFGVPITHIVEILGSMSPQPVPRAPDFVGGLVHYRGDVLTAVSARQLLGMPALRAPHAVLVLESPAGCFGVQVDAVKEVLTVPGNAFEPNPCTLEDRHKNLFAGAYKLGDGLLVMLDPARLDPILLAGQTTVA